MSQIGKTIKIGVAVPEKEPIPIKREVPVKPEPSRTEPVKEPQKVPA